MVALALATLDAWIMFGIRQAQTVDTSVWIALIAGVVGILTLIIQTRTQIKLAEINRKQDAQAGQIKEVHTAVNSERTTMIAKLDAMHEKISLLETAAGVRASEDAAIVANHAAKSTSLPAQVEVVNDASKPIPVAPKKPIN